ncbi:P-loop NTPase [Blautia wexlerae]|uniref:nucleotide-binding protein n=1 Tax=Blautia wexlerae TaxID=418240 RepID=UPI0035BEAC90
MKIAVCGKGGCGKSTVTSLLAKALARRGKEILVIDSDESNYGLYRQLGMKLPRDFTDYFGGKQNVLNYDVIKIYSSVF